MDRTVLPEVTAGEGAGAVVDVAGKVRKADRTSRNRVAPNLVHRASRLVRTIMAPSNTATSPEGTASRSISAAGLLTRGRAGRDLQDRRADPNIRTPNSTARPWITATAQRKTAT